MELELVGDPTVALSDETSFILRLGFYLGTQWKFADHWLGRSWRKLDHVYIEENQVFFLFCRFLHFHIYGLLRLLSMQKLKLVSSLPLEVHLPPLLRQAKLLIQTQYERNGEQKICCFIISNNFDADLYLLPLAGTYHSSLSWNLKALWTLCCSRLGVQMVVSYRHLSSRWCNIIPSDAMYVHLKRLTMKAFRNSGMKRL